MLRERFASYLRHAARRVAEGDLAAAESLERLAREVFERLGSPPELAWELHARRAARLLAAGDDAAAEAALDAAIAANDPAPSRERFDLLHLRGVARARQGHDERALTGFDEALALAAQLGPSFHGVAHTHVARADALRRLGRTDDARAALRAAIAIAEHSPMADRDAVVTAARRSLEAIDGRPPAPTAPDEPALPPTPASGTVDEAAYAAALADLDALIGLGEVKAQVRRLAELLRIAELRRRERLKTVTVSLHLVFEGGPGTGKTTVARLFGRLYHALGLLGSDRVTEVTRADLVAGYVGQTAAKTDAVVDGALDGILFLDEAYALVRAGSQGDFGQEAVAELLKRMEDDRDRLAVIVAGYPQEMEELLESNSGLQSRFSETIVFPDYAPAELVAIFERFAAEADYRVDPAAAGELRAVMDRLHAGRDRFFANARAARNLFDDAVAHQATRLLKADGDPDRDALMTLTAEDIGAAGAGALADA